MKGLVLGGGLKVKKKTSRKRSHLGHSQIKKALRTEKIPPGIIKKKKRALKIENNPTWDILK